MTHLPWKWCSAPACVIQAWQGTTHVLSTQRIGFCLNMYWTSGSGIYGSAWCALSSEHNSIDFRVQYFLIGKLRFVVEMLMQAILMSGFTKM